MNRRDIIKLAVLALALVLAVALVGRIDRAQAGAETELVRDAVRNAAVTCYAVEGAYPDSVDYLRDHYRLSYNEDRYMVFYDAFASNLMPAIFVAERGAADL